MHGAAHGQHQVADIFGDADGVAGFLVDGDGSGRGLGGKGRDGRRENVLDHGDDALLARGQEGVQREEDDGVEQAQGVIDQHGPAVITDDLGAVGSHQVGKVSAQAQRSDGHDQADELHDDVVQVDQQLADGGLVTAAGGHAEPDEDGKDDQGQHIGLVPQIREIGHGQGADDQLGGGLGLAHLAGGHCDGGAGRGAEQVDPDQDAGGGDQAGEDECADGAGQDAAQPLHVGHAAHRGGNGYKHQRDHDGEQQVEEDIAHRLDGSAHAGGECANERAYDNAAQNQDQVAVLLPEGFLFDDIRRCRHDVVPPFLVTGRPRRLSAVPWPFPGWRGGRPRSAAYSRSGCGQRCSPRSGPALPCG